MNREQIKFLRERLNRIVSSKPGRYERVDLPEPVSVIKARATMESAGKVIGAFEEKKTRATEARMKALSKMRSDCEKMIYFGDQKDALRLLDEFEAMEF